MLRVYLNLLLVFCSLTALSQNRAELQKRNGFKDIKLGMIIDSLKGYKFKKDFLEHNEFPAKLYSFENPNYARIGEVNVDKIEIKTYKDQIYEIIVVTEKDQRLVKALESLYGKADYDLKRETYFWRTEDVLLKFKSHAKHQLELLYISFPVYKKMKLDKNQKVDDIANDF